MSTVELCDDCGQPISPETDVVVYGPDDGVRHGKCFNKSRAIPRLTRTERLQLAADAGVDTWEDYRGER